MNDRADGATRNGAVGHAVVDTRPEADVFDDCVAALQAAQAADANWFAQFEDTDTSVCSRVELVDLLRRAPTAFAAGFLFAKIAMRNEIAEVTGRPFE